MTKLNTQFVGGQNVWNEIKKRSFASKARIYAAVAYFGEEGSKLLKLRSGDLLLVNMSLAAVKQGVTDPREIKKLMQQGVNVFSRQTLHAKIYIIDDVLICGSANVSNHSSFRLDEAALITTEKSTVQIAKDYLCSMCSEPVNEMYLQECLKAYRPPRFGTASIGPRNLTNRIQGKLWFIKGIEITEIPKADRASMKQIEDEAEKELPDNKHEVTSVRWYVDKPKLLESIQKFDWVLKCCDLGKTKKEVEPPCQVLTTRSFPTSDGETCFVLTMASPIDAEPISFTSFRKLARKIVPGFGGKRLHHRSFTNQMQADQLRMLWNPDGSRRNS